MNQVSNPHHPMSKKEFVLLMAFLMSVSAISIDSMLPAFPNIAKEFKLLNPNHAQYVLSLFFVGLGVGKLIFGPLSDAVGRKPTIYWGILVYGIGSMVAIYASSFNMLLVGRLLQGVGAASLRVVIVALIRDLFSGRKMAQTLSLITSIFVFAPAVAPSIGEIILLYGGWREIFEALFVLAVIGFIWFAIRQPETLKKNDRIPIRISTIINNTKEVLTNSTTVRYVLTSSFTFGAFIGYLASCQQLFESYGAKNTFSLWFASLALTLGFASFINSKLVPKIGMRKLVKRSLVLLIGLSGICAAVGFYSGIPFWLFMTFLYPAFCATGILFGNLNSIAMEPMGHIAGTASAAIGFFQTLLSVSIGGMIGQQFNHTPLPLILGFFLCSIIGLLFIFTDQSTD